MLRRKRKRTDSAGTLAEPTTIPNHVDGSMQESNDYHMICNPYLVNKNQKGIAGIKLRFCMIPNHVDENCMIVAGPSCTSLVGTIKLLPSPKLLEKLLDVTHESYGFRADLMIEAISLTNEYKCCKAGFRKDNHKLRCYAVCSVPYVMYVTHTRSYIQAAAAGSPCIHVRLAHNYAYGLPVYIEDTRIWAVPYRPSMSTCLLMNISTEFSAHKTNTVKTFLQRNITIMSTPS